MCTKIFNDSWGGFISFIFGGGGLNFVPEFVMKKLFPLLCQGLWGLIPYKHLALGEIFTGA